MTALRPIWPLVLVLVGVLTAQVSYAQHEGDIWVGRTSGGQLTIGGFPVAEKRVVLPPTSGILHGWADNNPGFDHVTTPVPEDDLYPLDAGAEIWLEVVELDPAFRVIDNGFQILDEPGKNTRLGDDYLHVHLTWHIDDTDPAFDELRTLWRGTFILIDNGTTGYATSEPFTVYFMNAELQSKPGDVNLDGVVNRFDVPAFFAVLADPPSASAEERNAADANLDGVVTDDDIGPLFALIVRPGSELLELLALRADPIAP
ncbi:MAG: hypothetical protein KKB50_18005 [Planctomycetes bacterium]|nr:hypothetical protein [Planctomycetota bacterium]